MELSEFEYIDRLRQQRMSWKEIEELTGQDSEVIRKRFSRFKNKSAPQTSPPSVPSVALKEMRTAAEKVPDKLTVTCAWSDDEVDIRDVWRKAEEEASENIRKHIERRKFDVTLPSSRVSCLTFLSDHHIAPGTPCDFKRMREDAELIRDTADVYAILGGDHIDNHIKHFSAVLNSRSAPQEQWLLFEYYLQILKDRILVATSGNHCQWTKAVAGFDMLGYLMKNNRIAYCPHETRLSVKCGTQQYKVAMRHQYRLNSSFNQSHSVKQWLRLGDDEFDIGCIGHHHEACVEQTVYRGKMVWCCRPGSYQRTSAYSEMYGYNHSIPSCPSFLIFPDRRHIIGLADVRDVPKILKVFNG